MSDIQKTIRILEDIPENISNKISMREISETLSIMFEMHENNNFEPTIEDFLEALCVRMQMQVALHDVEYTQQKN